MQIKRESGRSGSERSTHKRLNYNTPTPVSDISSEGREVSNIRDSHITCLQLLQNASSVYYVYSQLRRFASNLRHASRRWEDSRGSSNGRSRGKQRGSCRSPTRFWTQQQQQSIFISTRCEQHSSKQRSRLKYFYRMWVADR